MSWNSTGPKARAQRNGMERADPAEIRRLARAILRVQPLCLPMARLPRLLEALPDPAVIFGRDGVVLAANRALLRRAHRTRAEVDSGTVNLLDRVPDENYAVFEAAEGVFYGEASLARDLVRPLSLFARGDGPPVPDPYACAVFCPILEADGVVAGGLMALIQTDWEREKGGGL